MARRSTYTHAHAGGMRGHAQLSLQAGRALHVPVCVPHRGPDDRGRQPQQGHQERVRVLVAGQIRRCVLVAN